MSDVVAKVSEDEVFEMLGVLLNESNTEINSKTVFEDLIGWDSMGTLLLMAELDEKFAITLSEEQIKGLQEVADLLEIIKGNGNLAD